MIVKKKRRKRQKYEVGEKRRRQDCGAVKERGEDCHVVHLDYWTRGLTLKMLIHKDVYLPSSP